MVRAERMVLGLLLVAVLRTTAGANILFSALPCESGPNPGTSNPRDNLSCPSATLSLAQRCFNTSEVCNMNNFCVDGTDEGNPSANTDLDCDGSRHNSIGFQCSSTAVIIFNYSQLCDGHDDCGDGTDETRILCENKCLGPYYAGCSYTRECTTSAYTFGCGLCLTGFSINLNNPTGACLIEIGLESMEYIGSESGQLTGIICATLFVNPTHLDGGINGAFRAIENDYNISSGTATVNGLITSRLVTGSNAASDADFEIADRAIQLSRNQTTDCVTFSVSDDSEVEGIETFRVTITTSESFATVRPTHSSANISIVDNDMAPTLLISIMEAEKNESQSTARACISLQFETEAETLQDNLTVTVNFTFTGDDTFILSQSYTLSGSELESCSLINGPSSADYITAEVSDFLPLTANIVLSEANATIIAQYNACEESDTSSSIYGDYSWPKTKIDGTSNHKCVFGPPNSSASRECNSDSRWNDDIDFSNCDTQYQDIDIENITIATVVELVASLALLVDSTPENEQSLRNYEVIARVLNATYTVVRKSTFNDTDLKQIVLAVANIVDDLHDWEELQITNLSVIKVLEMLAEALAVNDDEVFDQVLRFKGNTSEIVIERRDISFLQLNGRIFNGTSQDQKERYLASIQLRASLFNNEIVRNNILGDEVAIVFTFYQTAALFPLRNGTRLPNTSSVIGALLGGIPPITDLIEPVTIILTIPTSEDELIKEAVCVSWNFTLLDGFGNWTDVGCVTSLDRKTNTVACNCTHLTNFAALVDICSRTEGDCAPAGTSGRALLVISYIGISLSIVGLILTIITMLCFSELRQRDASKFHVQLCVAMLGMLLVFAAGIEQTEVFAGCVVVSAIIHYFTLASVMWMGAEALLMFHKLVTVFFRTTTKYLVLISLFCWVAPILPVLISLLINPKYMVSYQEVSDQSSSFSSEEIIDFCFIGNTGLLFGAFLGPIVAVLLFNIVIFVIVIKVLFKHYRNKYTKKDKNVVSSVKQLLVGILGITVLFGISWLFGVFTISSASVTFQYIFTIFTSLQGFFIFFFFCVLGREAREMWIRLFRHVPKSLGYESGSTEKKAGGGASSQGNARRRKTQQRLRDILLRSSTDTTSEQLSGSRLPSEGINSVSSIEMEPLPSTTIKNFHAIEVNKQQGEASQNSDPDIGKATPLSDNVVTSPQAQPVPHSSKSPANDDENY